MPEKRQMATLLDVLSYIKETPSNTNREFLYEAGLNDRSVDYVMAAPQRVNPAILADLNSNWENPISVKPKNAAEIQDVLNGGEKVFINKKILAEQSIEIEGKGRAAAATAVLRNCGELKATKDCGWFLLIARRGATVELNGNGLWSSNKTKAIPVTASSNSTMWIKGGTFVCSEEAGECVYADKNAQVYVEGGTFMAEEGVSVPLLNVKNDGDVSQIRVRGGRFIGWNPEDGDDVLGGNFVDDSYKAVEVEPGVWEVRRVEE